MWSFPKACVTSGQQGLEGVRVELHRPVSGVASAGSFGATMKHTLKIALLGVATAMAFSANAGGPECAENHQAAQSARTEVQPTDEVPVVRQSSTVQADRAASEGKANFRK